MGKLLMRRRGMTLPSGLVDDVWYEGENISAFTRVGHLFADGATDFSVLFTFTTSSRGDAWNIQNSNGTDRMMFSSPASNAWGFRLGDNNTYAYASYTGNSQTARKTVITFNKDTREGKVYDGGNVSSNVISESAFSSIVNANDDMRVCSWRGNSNDLVVDHIKIYKRIVTQDEITAYLSS